MNIAAIIRSATEHCGKYIYGWHGQNRTEKGMRLRREREEEGPKSVGAVAPFVVCLRRNN